jgi:hypothetical protein
MFSPVHWIALACLGIVLISFSIFLMRDLLAIRRRLRK